MFEVVEGKFGDGYVSFFIFVDDGIGDVVSLFERYIFVDEVVSYIGGEYVVGEGSFYFFRVDFEGGKYVLYDL